MEQKESNISEYNTFEPKKEINEETEETEEGEYRLSSNMECVDEIEDIDIIDTISEFEVIDHSSPVLINNRYRRQTWYEYFRKLYMVSVILIISLVIYFYYSYRRSDVVDKL